MILLVIILSTGVVEKPMSSDLACNMAALQAPGYVAVHHPGARLVSARCERSA